MMMIILSFVLGIMIGSFLNVVIYRLPIGLSVVSPRSSCTSCGSMISWYENIPIVSYLFLRGKCSQCGKSFSLRYLLIEVVVGIIFALITMNKDPFVYPLEWIVLIVIACVFVCHFFIDLEHHLLLDSLNIVLTLIALLNIYVYGELGLKLIGGAIGYLGPLIVSLLFLKLRGKIGMGGGDIKLFGALGLIIGPFGILMNLFLSSFLGSICTLIVLLSKKLKKNTPFAFGPYILLIASIQIFSPEIFKKITYFFFPE